MQTLKQYKSDPVNRHWKEISAQTVDATTAERTLKDEVAQLEKEAAECEFEAHVTWDANHRRVLVLFTYKGVLREGYKLVIE